MKAIQSQSEIYDKWEFHDYSEIKVRRIKKYFPANSKDMRFLDVGSGYGEFAQFLDKNIKYTGIDFSEKQVSKGKKLGLNVIYHDLTKKWPFKDESFDIILASEIIEHIFDTDFFISECRRVLKKKGTLIITTPNICYLGGRLRCLFGRRPAMIEFRAGRGNAGHIRAFSYYDLKELLKDHKMKIDKYTGFDFYLPFISTRTRYLGWISDLLSVVFPKLSSGFVIKAKKV